MERRNLTELGYITAIANVPSIWERGILSFRRAREVVHVDLAMAEIQDRRDGKLVPDVRRRKPAELHDYAPLYICARNPMMYVRSSRHEEICVLRVDPGVLELDGVVVTDGNAASDYSRFAAAPQGLAEVDKEMTFAEYWTDPRMSTHIGRRSVESARRCWSRTASTLASSPASTYRANALGMPARPRPSRGR